MRKTVGVLFGGMSSEHEVSLRTATSILWNFPRMKYDPVMIGITKDGKWYYYEGDINWIEKNIWQEKGVLIPAVLSPNRAHHGLLLLKKDEYRVQKLDLLFPAVHGANCEDGSLQGLCELAGIPYVGSHVTASAACMDKELTHVLLENGGIKTAAWRVLRKEALEDLNAHLTPLEKALGYPMFVKPANGGSSVGVSRVENRVQLMAGLMEAFLHDARVLVEEGMVGVEVECAVLGNSGDIRASTVGEVVPTHTFYDYAGKYLDDSTRLYVPARLAPEVTETVRNLARKAYKIMGCEGLARVDFFVCHDGRIIVNEINTLPGFTSISMYPKLFEHDGIPYGMLLDRLMELALARGTGLKGSNV